MSSLFIQRFRRHKSTSASRLSIGSPDQRESAIKSCINIWSTFFKLGQSRPFAQKGPFVWKSKIQTRFYFFIFLFYFIYLNFFFCRNYLRSVSPLGSTDGNCCGRRKMEICSSCLGEPNDTNSFLCGGRTIVQWRREMISRWQKNRGGEGWYKVVIENDIGALVVGRGSYW